MCPSFSLKINSCMIRISFRGDHSTSPLLQIVLLALKTRQLSTPEQALGWPSTFVIFCYHIQNLNQYRDQCEDLRSILSKRHQDEVCRDRAEQLRLKEEERKKEQLVEKMYSKLWDEDRQTKCKREEMEAALQIERNREMLKVV